MKRIGLDKVLFVNHEDMLGYVDISEDGDENKIVQQLLEIIKK